MKVSVVVPVWNPGPYIHDLVASLRSQTMPADRFEVVFVDDGSTDGTGALLDAVAAEVAQFRVIHTPNSGWPGRPRNLGIDAAVGEYVFLADHDDRLAPDALERLTAFADRHDADVVLGKMVGVRRSVPTEVFARSLVDGQRRPDLLISALTPQKLYRRSLLDEHGIRFPEGPRRLEDHVFVVQAYLRARRVSVYADSPVYYFVLREDGQNASRRPVVWADYFANAAEAIGVVDAEAPDEATRIVMRRRWLRVEALRRLRGQRYLARGADRAALVAAARDLVREQYPLAEIDLLGPFDRIAARLLLDGRDADLAAFAAWEAGVRVRPRLLAARLDRATGMLRIELTAVQRAAAAPPELLVHPPTGYPSAAENRAMERLPEDARIRVMLRRSATESVVAEADQSIHDGELVAVASVDTAALGAGRWTVRVRFAGVQRIGADDLLVDAAQSPRVHPRSATGPGGPVRLGIGDDGRLAITVGRTPWTRRRVTAGVRRRLARLRVRSRRR